MHASPVMTMVVCPTVLLCQNGHQKDQYREQAGQRRHDAVAQTIQSVVHGSDPPVMQDEPRIGGNAKY